MAFKTEGKEMCRIFVFAKCCWSIHSKWQDRNKGARRSFRPSWKNVLDISYNY